MKVIYVAFDGTQFETEDACKAYETNCFGVRMFAINGDETPDVECAYLVYIPFIIDPEDDSVRGAKWFLNQCAEREKAGLNDCGSDGIDEQSSGLFYWSEWEGKYIWIEENAARILISKFSLEDIDNI